MMKSIVVATPPENLSGAPVLKLTVTGEAGHGGVGPVSAAEIVSPAPGVTVCRNPGVHTEMAAWDGAAIKGETKAVTAVMPAILKEKVIDFQKNKKSLPPPFFVKHIS